MQRHDMCVLGREWGDDIEQLELPMSQVLIHDPNPLPLVQNMTFTKPKGRTDGLVCKQ